MQSLQFHILKVHQEDPETFVNENLFDNDTLLMPPPKVIKIEDAQGQRIEFVTTNSEGKILNTNIKGLKEEQILKTTENAEEENSKVNILEQYIIDDNPTTSASVAQQTIILSSEAFTVIPLESDGGIIEPITTKSLPSIISPETKKEQRKTLAESLAAAIADNDEELSEEEEEQEPTFTEEDLKLKDNVSKLLDMLVDSATLKKFGWPDITEETVSFFYINTINLNKIETLLLIVQVLCKVIENCGHDLTKDQHNYKDLDYATRMREYVKLLFTVVIHNDSIKELLNNYPIDEVIEYVLGNDDDDEDEDDDNVDNKTNGLKEINDNDNDDTIKREKDA